VQLLNLIKPIDEMTDEELEERIRTIRHKRDVVRPAAAKHVERAAKVGGQGKITKAADLLAGLTDEQRAELLAALGE
jgi:flagellar motility protein MotE (MotC chaperone)